MLSLSLLFLTSLVVGQPTTNTQAKKNQNVLFRDIEHRTVVMAAHQMDTREHEDFLSNQEFQRYANNFEEKQKFQFVVHIKDPVSKFKKEMESDLNVEFSHYLPHNSFLFYGSQQEAQKINDHNDCLWVGAVLPVHRIAAELLPESSWQTDEAPKALSVQMVPGVSPSAWNSAAASLPKREDCVDAVLLRANNVVLELSADADWSCASRAAFWASQVPSSHHIAPLRQPRTLNDYATGVTWTGAVEGITARITGPVDGTGVTVGLIDTGIDANSCYFAGAKVTGSSMVGDGDGSDDTNGHGTAMAGTCCGAGGPGNNGVATGASLHVTDISRGDVLPREPPIAEALAASLAGGATIGLMAFGARAKWYNEISQAIDGFAAMNPTFLPVVAAGNDGYAGTPAIVGPGYAKNAIVVGAVQNSIEGFEQATGGAAPQLTTWLREYRGTNGPNVVASVSSRGPTNDGRLKPDVVAPGEFVVTAAKGACASKSRRGTSIAAAVVAGAAAIVSQHLKSANGGMPPSASLIKAMLIHSAQPVQSAAVSDSEQSADRVQAAGPWPSPIYGFGRVSLDHVIKRSGSPVPAYEIQTQEGTLADGASAQFCFTVAEGGSLRATLVWTDVGSSPMAGNALVNNLDLVVWRGSDGFAWRGNNAEAYDGHNTAEGVMLDNLPAGVYGVGVNAQRVVGGEQAYSLVVSGGISPGNCQSAARCALDCAAPNGQCGAGTCVCSNGKGFDCSIQMCPGNCGGNGVCDGGTGKCTCGRGWSGPGCTMNSPPPTTITVLVNKRVFDTGISDSLFTGLLILAYFIGCGCALFCGGFAGAIMMKKRREAQMGR